MPSERPSAAPGLLAVAGRLLRSQGLGVASGFASALLLAVGSVVLTATRDGASRDVHMDDLRAFFTHPSPWHLWLYLLAGTLALYGLNTVVCTADTVIARWRAGLRQPRAYAAAVIHFSFVLALLAHLVGGLGGRDEAPVVLAPGRPATLDDGRVLSLQDVDVRLNPDDTPREIAALVRVTEPDGRQHDARIAYNHPLARGLGADLVLLAKLDRGAVILSHRHAPGHPLVLLAGLLMLVGVAMMGRHPWAARRPR